MDKMEKCGLKNSTFDGLGIIFLYFPSEFGNNQDGEEMKLKNMFFPPVVTGTS